jgi:hypothetical protein
MSGVVGQQLAMSSSSALPCSGPDWRITIQDMVAEEDRVAVRAIAKGTRTEEAVGIPFPRPCYMELTWIAIYRIKDSRIAEVWVITPVEMSRWVTTSYLSLSAIPKRPDRSNVTALFDSRRLGIAETA